MRIRINEQPASEEDTRRIMEFGAHEDDIDPRKHLLERLQTSCYLDEENPKRPLNARERLLEQYSNDGLVLFLGAGISVRSGIPTWASLIQDVFQKIKIDPANAEQAASSSIYARFELAALRSDGHKKFCDILYDSLYNQTGF